VSPAPDAPGERRQRRDDRKRRARRGAHGTICAENRRIEARRSASGLLILVGEHDEGATR